MSDDDICPASKIYPCDPVCERCGRCMEVADIPSPATSTEGQAGSGDPDASG